jgi:hypothetical protein
LAASNSFGGSTPPIQRGFCWLCSPIRLSISKIALRFYTMHENDRVCSMAVPAAQKREQQNCRVLVPAKKL